ncbi:solute carrier family 41 member 1 [Nephila pilipes]|uniref:Solute carrier family 41 member 1 n=1 Tax=Nephila pilipes TaxID=299642 RepID=A0A8X6U0F9_NEPPI|nr:solute carrier family 41 member 1 [Nephila pilipes]
MVPRAASDSDHLLATNTDSGEDKEFSDSEFKSGKIDTNETLIPNAFVKDSKPDPWTFDNDQPGTDDGHRSLLEDHIIIPDTKETMLSVALQVFVPFLIAGFGTVGAGLVLDVVQHWEVFKVVSEIFILVPALLGLKGNLEMTLASRLSTQANLGHMDTVKEQWKMATGNMALIQCQAIVVGFLASLFAMIMDWIPEGEFNLEHALLLCAASIVTASLASFILGCVMVGVVICSRKCHINPDNVATPIAASLGDLTTLSLLAGICKVLFAKLDSPRFAISVISFFLLLLPFWITVARRNKYTREVLQSGVGGNLVAVQASRISTYLHQRSKLGVLPAEDSDGVCNDPITAFFGKSVHSTTARVLILMVIPGHLVFTYGIRFVNAGHTSVTAMFLIFYLLAALIQVAILLYAAHVMIHWMWVRHIDPDNSAIPYLTALGDLLGTALLAAAFMILYEVGDKDYDVGE